MQEKTGLRTHYALDKYREQHEALGRKVAEYRALWLRHRGEARGLPPPESFLRASVPGPTPASVARSG